MKQISNEIVAAFAALGVEAKLSNSNRPDLADYMCDAAFGAAKTLRRHAADIAKEVCDTLSQDGYTASVAGGFVNIRLDDDTIVAGLMETPDRPQTEEIYIIDMGGPNTAKPMHVGHLRSLVIGNSLARILTYMGHRVLKDVHYGDWGYQMGLLLAALPVIPDDIETIEAAYPAAALRAKDDPAFKAAAHAATVALQAGDEDHVTRWRKLREMSDAYALADFDTLGVNFDVFNGESDAYPYVRTAEATLTRRGKLEESEGALIVPTADGPLMFRNSEGGYLYGATDLGTVILREHEFAPTSDNPLHVLYVVDERQSQYFRQMIAAADEMLICSKLEHIPFGTVNGPDGKPFKTRAGGVPRLATLMQEATDKAAERESRGSPRRVAMAALKFGDLINRRTGSYPFDLDKALNFEGKTGPYMLYQIVRIKSIIDKAEVPVGEMVITDADERALAMHMLDFMPTVTKAAETRMPHLVAEYAYELSQRFSRFYTGPSIKDNTSRLTLSKMALSRLETLMTLLGIETVAAM